MEKNGQETILTLVNSGNQLRLEADPNIVRKKIDQMMSNQLNNQCGTMTSVSMNSLERISDNNIIWVYFTEEIALRKDPHARLKTVSAETKDILQELEKEYKAPEKKEVKKEVGIILFCSHVYSHVRLDFSWPAYWINQEF